jgi:hypothetical protein
MISSRGAQTDSPDHRREAGSRLSFNGESRRQRNHALPKCGIPKRRKTDTYPRLFRKFQYFLSLNYGDTSIASEFFTGDYLSLKVDEIEDQWV